MAYNNGYPMGYQPYYQQNYAQQMAPQQNQLQIQNGGFVPVPSEDVARNYPVAPGNSVTFKNENAPYVYTKTMGFSQLDRPIFEKYKLVREDDVPPVEAPKQVHGNEPIDEIRKEIDSIWDEINALKQQDTRTKDSED